MATRDEIERSENERAAMVSLQRSQSRTDEIFDAARKGIRIVDQVSPDEQERMLAEGRAQGEAYQQSRYGGLDKLNKADPFNK